MAIVAADPKLIEDMRNPYFRNGWLRSEIERSVEVMTEALAALPKHKETARRHLQVRIDGAKHTLALLQSADGECAS